MTTDRIRRFVIIPDVTFGDAWKCLGMSVTLESLHVSPMSLCVFSIGHFYKLISNPYQVNVLVQKVMSQLEKI